MSASRNDRPRAAYVRVSTGAQTAENQRPDLERLGRTRGLAVVATFEEAASAAKRRPIFDRMMADAKRPIRPNMAGNVADVLALDRAGVELVSVREPWLDTGGPVRDLLLAIFSWVAEQERRRLGERTKAGLGARP